jgi:hypothetical protein
VYCSKAIELPGFFRPEKKWDLIVVHQDVLVAAVEFKSHIGPSFGNNFNNRSEEAIGSAQDIWTAFREGAFRTSDRPWLGFVMLLEDCEGSTRPVQVKQPHFDVFPEFQEASYSDRYKLLMTKLVLQELLWVKRMFVHRIGFRRTRTQRSGTQCNGTRTRWLFEPLR